ncbi:endonuclease/exonuclease/phosphatase family protein [Thiomonas bhubaneswarensis]|uniref:Metal-dependent hydrolase, endonuclease/exonuclease/phosphatase family n=1 Tax=Thiomonas bhubaneswarensis TaxID=339866 RepID=A0A0K6HX24_9BURK|nr:endonuclease/exonuclease/phosphatase family protein [Thiomonas bhubaneswarensis]CUA95353.1 Metal-dependent hydrolase, endonuclease/exonuclease/phosphatase family [Thiomonas bhubaneswarensis]
MELRVASYNIHKGVLGHGPAKRASILELQTALQGMEADLVFLQEVQFLHQRHASRLTGWPALPQHDFLAQALGMHAAYRTNACTRHGEHGNALLSRYPIIGIDHCDVSDHRFEQRGLLHVQVALPKGGPLHCIVVHFGLFAVSRQRQTDRLLDYIAARVPEKAALIVAGDFNDWHGRIGPQLLRQHLVDVSEPKVKTNGKTSWRNRVRTYPARLPLMPLDRIYARGLTASEIGLGWGRAWARLSDHAPLLAALRCDLPDCPEAALPETADLADLGNRLGSPA